MGYYKYIILAFLVGGVVLVGVFLYQNYAFERGMGMGTTLQPPSEQLEVDQTTNPVGGDLDQSVISIANTKETVYGMFDSVSSSEVVLNVNGTITEFPINSTEMILMCTDQDLYEVENLDLNLVSSSSSHSPGDMGQFLSAGDPVVVLSLADEEGVYYAYAVVKRETGCN